MIARWFLSPGRGVLAAIAVSLTGAGFSAHAGHSDSPRVAIAPPAPIGFDAQDHFPGAALLYAAAPADLAAVPPLRPAAPFVSRGTSIDHARALLCLTTAIYYEAANEPDDGQAAVAQVILNRVRHPAFPATVCGVVYQGSDRRGCQFSFACDGALARTPIKSAWDRARGVAARALAGWVFAPVGLATHYHSYAVAPPWNRSLVMTGVFGAHFFHRWQGAWGTAAAFRQSYRGGEPTHGAPQPIAPSPAAPPPRVMVAQVPIAVPTASGASGATPDRDADAESQILDKWKDSGRPLR